VRKRVFYEEHGPAPAACTAAGAVSDPAQVEKLFYGKLLDRVLVDKDMCRLFIDGISDDYFQSDYRQQLLRDVLSVWCAANPPYYRQGMHEVCAMLLLAVEWEEEAWRSECSEGNAGDWGRACFCGENNAEADVYWLLDAVMRRGLGVIYCPEGLDGHSVGADFLTLIQEELLKDLHPVLWAHLQASAIQPQLYCVSWTRLLFGRTFPPAGNFLFVVWDYLFEDSDIPGCTAGTESEFLTTIGPIQYKLAAFILSLLISLKDELLLSDEVTSMTILMRYAITESSDETAAALGYVLEAARHIERFILAKLNGIPDALSHVSQLRLSFRGDLSCLSSPATCVLDGYLSKKGKVVRSWKRRWIVLTKESVSYYTDDTLAVRRGHMQLTHDTTVLCEDGRLHRLKFMIVTPGQRPRIFLASNEDGRRCWVRAIENVLQTIRERAFMGPGSVWGDADGESGTPTEATRTISANEKLPSGMSDSKTSWNSAVESNAVVDPSNNIIVRYTEPFSCLDNTQLPVVLAAGWLMKRGTIGPSWKLRWCELSLSISSDGARQCVFSFYDKAGENDSQKKPSKQLGSMILTSNSLVLNRSFGPVPNKFALYTPPPLVRGPRVAQLLTGGVWRNSKHTTDKSAPDTGNGFTGWVGNLRKRSQVIFLAAVSEEERNDWKNIIGEAVAEFCDTDSHPSHVRQMSLGSEVSSASVEDEGDVESSIGVNSQGEGSMELIEMSS